MTPSITLSLTEAQAALNTLRNTQMHLGAVEAALTPEQRAQFMLFSHAYAGVLMQAVNNLEAALHEVGVIDMSGHGANLQNGAELAIAQFHKWEMDICDAAGAPDFARREEFRGELRAMLMLVRLAAQNTLPGLSQN